jgi:coproporphyrinogen III oxidase-like Fe-S oxidoreductase
LRAIETILGSGVQHHNIDLIYGFPGQHPEDLWHEFDAIAQLDLRSVTWYQLWQHMDTPLRQQELHKRQVTLEDIVRLKCTIAAAMTALGFQRDKVDWFLKDTSEGQRQQEHKWACGDLLGLGVSAYGFVNGIYYRNHPTFQNYRAAVETSGFGLGYAMCLTPDQLVRRQFALGIKRAQGVALSILELMPLASQTQLRSRILALESAGLVTIVDGCVRLTAIGELFGDNVANELALAENDRTFRSQWRTYANK